MSPSGPLVTLGWVTPEPRVTFAGVSPGALRHAPLPAPRPRGLACRGRGRDRLSVPAPLSFSPPTACRLPRRPPLPPPPDTPPATLSPPRDHAWLGGRRAPDPPVPLNASRHPPPAAPGARGPRPPPPARRCAALCGGARGAAGGRPRPLHFFQECAPMPHAQHPPDTPRGSFLGGLCQGCLCHPAAPWSRLAGSPRSPGSRLPGSALGPFVTLRCPRPAPGGLPAAAGGATASLSPPPCHSPLQRRAGSRAAPRSRPHQTRPLRPCPLLAITHGWAGAAPPTPPFP